MSNRKRPCCVVCLVAQSCPTFRTHGLQRTRLLCPWEFSRQEYWSGLPCPPPGDLPNPGIKDRSSALQVDSLPSEPPGKPMNTGVGSLSFLQGIFPTQELNQGFLCCMRIHYQLSHQGNPPKKRLWLNINRLWYMHKLGHSAPLHGTKHLSNAMEQIR